MKTTPPIPPKPTSPSADEAGDHARDPLADVPPPDDRTDRFTIQPGEIEFVIVGSIEVVIHSAGAENAKEP
jgi:hypothetical protein